MRRCWGIQADRRLQWIARRVQPVARLPGEDDATVRKNMAKQTKRSGWHKPCLHL
ncbi:hypothetical protein NZK35_02940 [Stieleria sp. ICT_E10.1]|uniref:hypothetical protein n=1 Tax=Stieleria sedimenti TaxID=2976331 RepID=UPI0021804567|nr:hypothetical protein [Stieleria sedimenti]MCS7465627.1 hypothetical protein [Stieleria sedimenti]